MNLDYLASAVDTLSNAANGDTVNEYAFNVAVNGLKDARFTVPYVTALQVPRYNRLVRRVDNAIARYKKNFGLDDEFSCENPLQKIESKGFLRLHQPS